MRILYLVEFFGALWTSMRPVVHQVIDVIGGRRVDLVWEVSDRVGWPCHNLNDILRVQIRPIRKAICARLNRNRLRKKNRYEDQSIQFEPYSPRRRWGSQSSAAVSRTPNTDASP